MQTNIYTLPELTFVGGKTQELYFNLKTGSRGRYNADGCSVNFSICNYSNKTGTPLISLTPEIIMNEDGVADVVHVTIPSDNTVRLYGKYIYQLTIIDISGKVDVPNQGIMNITKNINTNYIESF